MVAIRQLTCFALTVLLLHAADGQLELDGQIEEMATPVHVQLFDTESPFNTSTTSNSRGHFRFRALRPGTYIVSAHIRGHGEARRTVVITQSLADRKGIVNVAVPLPPPTSSVERARRRSTVSVSQLSIP